MQPLARPGPAPASDRVGRGIRPFHLRAEQSGDGRPHNNRGYTMWMAGGGVQGGTRFGRCDETGAAVEGRVHLHDLHATILNQLGLDHTELTYRYSGRDFRLTDVHGRVVTEFLG